MYTLIQKFHSGWAYLVLLILVLVIVNSLKGISSKKEFMPSDKKIALFGLIAAHIQLLVGLILYFVSEKGFKAFAIEGAMKNPELRLTMLEHPLINSIAIALITIGWSKHKKGNESSAKFKTIAIFYGLGLALILSRIPWSIWF